MRGALAVIEAILLFTLLAAMASCRGLPLAPFSKPLPTDVLATDEQLEIRLRFSAPAGPPFDFARPRPERHGRPHHTRPPAERREDRRPPLPRCRYLPANSSPASSRWCRIDGPSSSKPTPSCMSTPIGATASPRTCVTKWLTAVCHASVPAIPLWTQIACGPTSYSSGRPIRRA